MPKLPFRYALPAVAALAAASVAAVVQARPTAAGPAPALCKMDVTRGKIPASFAIDACIDEKGVWLRNDLPIPVDFAAGGDVGSPDKISLDQGLAAVLTRRRYPAPLLLLPHDLVRIPIGAGPATVTVTDTDAGGYYALATTVATFVPAGRAKEVYETLTKLVTDLDDAFARYASCKRVRSRARCRAVLVRDVSFAIGRAAVVVFRKGVVSAILGVATYGKWLAAQPEAVRKVIGSKRTIKVAARSSSPFVFDPTPFDASKCGGGAPLLDFTYHFEQSPDTTKPGESEDRYWALDSGTEAVRVWPTGGGRFCGIRLLRGTFTTVSGVSPNGTGSVRDGLTGTFQGGSRFTFEGTYAPTRAPTGDVGTLQAGCVISADRRSYECPTNVSWRSFFFSDWTAITPVWDEWIYVTPSNGSWLQETDRTAGDIRG